MYPLVLGIRPVQWPNSEQTLLLDRVVNLEDRMIEICHTINNSVCAKPKGLNARCSTDFAYLLWMSRGGTLRTGTTFDGLA